MIGDTVEHIAEIGFWIETVQLGRLDQAVDGGSPLTAGIRSSKQPVLPAKRKRSDGALDGVVVDGKRAVIEIAGQCIPARECISDGARDIAAAWHASELSVNQACICSISGLASLWRTRRRSSGGLPKIAASMV